jgi:hypothetical protein
MASDYPKGLIRSDLASTVVLSEWLRNVTIPDSQSMGAPSSDGLSYQAGKCGLLASAMEKDLVEAPKP